MAPLQKRLVDEALARGARLLLPLYQLLVYILAVIYLFAFSIVVPVKCRPTRLY